MFGLLAPKCCHLAIGRGAKYPIHKRTQPNLQTWRRPLNDKTQLQEAGQRQGCHATMSCVALPNPDAAEQSPDAAVRKRWVQRPERCALSYAASPLLGRARQLGELGLSGSANQRPRVGRQAARGAPPLRPLNILLNLLRAAISGPREGLPKVQRRTCTRPTSSCSDGRTAGENGPPVAAALRRRSKGMRGRRRGGGGWNDMCWQALGCQ